MFKQPNVSSAIQHRTAAVGNKQKDAIARSALHSDFGKAERMAKVLGTVATKN